MDTFYILDDQGNSNFLGVDVNGRTSGFVDVSYRHHFESNSYPLKCQNTNINTIPYKAFHRGAEVQMNLLVALTFMAYFSWLLEPVHLGKRHSKASYFYRHACYFLSDSATIV